MRNYLEIIKNHNYTIKNGKIKHLMATNLQFIEPTEYLITYPITLTILEYKVNEIIGIFIASNWYQFLELPITGKLSKLEFFSNQL